MKINSQHLIEHPDEIKPLVNLCRTLKEFDALADALDRALIEQGIIIANKIHAMQLQIPKFSFSRN